MPLFRKAIIAQPISAKELEIKQCSITRACKLNALWHSRLPKIDASNVLRNSDYCAFVAEYDDIAYACAIWSSPVARLLNGKGILELRRLAISPTAPTNTASRMLSLMRKHIHSHFQHIVMFVSYQDTEVHAGTIYKASGWTPVDTTKSTKTWDMPNRKRAATQSSAQKIRWELQIRSKPACVAKCNLDGASQEHSSFTQQDLLSAARP